MISSVFSSNESIKYTIHVYITLTLNIPNRSKPVTKNCSMTKIINTMNDSIASVVHTYINYNSLINS